MSLSDELAVEAANEYLNRRSQIEIFLDTLPAEDRADFEEWLKNPKNCSAMYRVLRRRGLPVALPTFTAWVRKCR